MITANSPESPVESKTKTLDGAEIAVTGRFATMAQAQTGRPGTACSFGDAGRPHGGGASRPAWPNLAAATMLGGGATSDPGTSALAGTSPP